MALLKEVFGQRYGRLGRLSESEWKRILHSNEGLFKKIPPLKVPGPTLNSQGQVIADTLYVEVPYFYKDASKEQVQLYEELEHINPIASREYVLVIIGALEQWKKDIRWLKLALVYLRKKELLLRREEEHFQKKSH